MLTEIYMEALLVDEEMADQIWYMRHADMIDDELAAIAWVLLAVLARGRKREANVTTAQICPDSVHYLEIW